MLLREAHEQFGLPVSVIIRTTLQDLESRAGIGVTYTNECVDISLSASRRFTSSTILVPSTDISFTVGLRGFTTKTRDKSYVRTCEQ